MRSIDIDFDIHKMIEIERRGFEEADNTVLRRLLRLDAPTSEASHAPSQTSLAGAWASDGVLLPSGTQLRMKYNGRVHEGVVRDGAWLVEGSSYSSPSGAARGVALTKRGKHPNLDGWIYWEARSPGGSLWVSLAQLRANAKG